MSLDATTDILPFVAEAIAGDAASTVTLSDITVALIDKYALRYAAEEGEDPHPQENEPIRVYRPQVEIKDEDGNVTGTTGNNQWYTKTSKTIDPNESLEIEEVK